MKKMIYSVSPDEIRGREPSDSYRKSFFRPLPEEDEPDVSETTVSVEDGRPECSCSRTKM